MVRPRPFRGKLVAMTPHLPPAPTPVVQFLAAHPRYAVLPAPYFEPGTDARAYLDLAVRTRAFVPGHPHCQLEVDAGSVTRLEPGPDGNFTAFIPLVDKPLTHVEVRLYQDDDRISVESTRHRVGLEHAASPVSRDNAPRFGSTRHGVRRHLVARFPLYLRPWRYVTQYTRGPFAHQISREWGEDGTMLVLLQRHYPATYDRLKHPVLYVGGDFNYQHIEGLVRYFRTHGVDALGYKPDYDRKEGETMLQMAEADYPDVRRWLELASGAHSAHIIGLCVGGLLVRGLEHEDRIRREPGWPSLFASLTTVGTPNTGSRLADLYNGMTLAPTLHRLLTGDPHIHQYKDARQAMTAFNRAVGLRPEAPTRCVVLDAANRPLDNRYWFTNWPLKWLTGAEEGRAPATVHTDGLILSDGQALGRPFATWNTDHAGMINDGRAGSYFDAYAAHSALLDALEPPGGTP